MRWDMMIYPGVLGPQGILQGDGMPPRKLESLQGQSGALADLNGDARGERSE